MREIKFRAWDGETMIENALYAEYQHPSKHGDINLPGHWQTGFSNCKKLYLMQYTGLKDKNGVEIYEGDILEKPFDPEYTNTKWQDREIIIKAHRHVVLYDYLRCRFRGKAIINPYPWNEDIFWPHVKNNYTVIGNIHENPELLESEK